MKRYAWILYVLIFSIGAGYGTFLSYTKMRERTKKLEMRVRESGSLPGIYSFYYIEYCEHQDERWKGLCQAGKYWAFSFNKPNMNEFHSIMDTANARLVCEEVLRIGIDAWRKKQELVLQDELRKWDSAHVPPPLYEKIYTK